jgi:hypothetical protein
MSDMAVNPTATTALWSSLPAAPTAPTGTTEAPAGAGPTAAPPADSSTVSGTDRLYTQLWTPELGPTGDTGAPRPAVDQKNWAEAAVTERWNAEIVLPEPPRPPIDGGTFRSHGDPHEISGDGLKFDNYLTGTFTAFQSASGDLVLQKFQEKDDKGRWAGATLNKAAGIKVGDNTISYDIRGDELTINGKKVSTAPGSSYALPDGGSVSIGKDSHITVNSALGDKITVEKRDGYIDFRGEVSASRPGGSVFGSLGSFDEDKDPTNDLIRPDGSAFPITYVPNKSANNQIGEKQSYVNEFLELWRVPTDKDLIPSR